MIYSVKNMLSIFFLIIIFFFTACSANTLQTSSESRKVEFEQVFAEQCIEKEIRNSVNKEIDRQRFSVPCSCIATKIATDLPIPDIEKFLDENKSTHTLSILFDQAAYFCVQKKKLPKSPDLFKRK